MVKFAHLADIHLDAWREDEFKRLNLLAFEKAMKDILKEKVDFIIIAGDLFHVSIPSIKSMRLVAKYFKKLKELGVKVFIVPGSHDYSKDDMSIIDVLEDAGLCVNLAKGDVDENGKISLKPYIYEDVVLYGVMGKKNGLEEEIYKNLKSLTLNKEKINIFVMHSGVEELNSKKFEKIPSIPFNLIPKGFDYYASGHIHEHAVKETLDGKVFVFPGALYPANFKELEETKGEGYYVIVEINKSKEVKVIKKTIKLYDVAVLEYDVEGMEPQTITSRILQDIDGGDLENKIVLLKLKGVVKGSIAHINFKDIKARIMDKNCYAYKKNISKLSSYMLNEDHVIVKEISSISDIEKEVFQDNIKDEKFLELALNLIKILEVEKNEEETQEAYRSKILKEAITAISKVIDSDD